MADKYSPKDIKMAVGVASDKRYAGGNMTGAVKAIEKIKKGLSSHPQVAAVLKRQNEGKMKTFDEIRKPVEERTEADCENMVCKNCGDKFGMPTERSCMYDSKDPNGKNWMEKVDEAKYKVEIAGGIETVTARTEKEAIMKAAKAQGVSKSVNKPGGPKVKVTKIDEGIIGNLVKKTAKAAGGAVVNRLTTTGRAKIAQKKIDKHNTKQDQKDTIQRAKDAGKSAFGLTQKSRAANAKKKLDKIAKKKAALDTIQRAKDLKKKPVTNEETTMAKTIAEIREGLTKKSVETGKVKTGASKSRIGAMQKQDDDRPTLRKNEAKRAKQTHMFDNEKDARAKAKEIGGKYVKGTGKSAGKHAAISEGKKMDSAAMKRAMDAFKKRGGKVKKVAPGKAAGYHGKDDPGDDIQGMMDRGDTKGFNRKKKVKSMGREQTEASLSGAKEIDSKKMSAYMKFAKDKKIDDDSIRMARDNPNHAETKRMMKNKDFAKALKMYIGAEK